MTMWLWDSGEPNNCILFFVITAVEVLSNSRSETKWLSLNRQTDWNVNRFFFNYLHPLYWSCVHVWVCVSLHNGGNFLSTDQTKENDKILTLVKAFSSNCLAISFILLQRKILSSKLFSKLKNRGAWVA